MKTDVQNCQDCGKDFPLRQGKHYALNLCPKCGKKRNDEGTLVSFCMKTVPEGYYKQRKAAGL